MKARKVTAEFDILPPTEAPAPRVIKDRAKEALRVIHRLQAIIATHAESARHMNIPMGLPDLLAVIAALHADADGLNPAPHLATPDEVTFYLRQGLYEELRAEPSNIFQVTKVSPETTRYEALPVDFWKECLDLLRTRLIALGDHCVEDRA